MGSPVADFRLLRNALGRLDLVDLDGTVHAGVVPVRAFPIEAPEQGISLVSADGRELAWIEQMDQLPAAERQLVREELDSREFVPEIRRLTSVSTFSTPSIWQVETDRGSTQLVLKGEEDIRLLPGERTRLLISSGHGIVFLVPDLRALDRRSRKLLERFL